MLLWKKQNRATAAAVSVEDQGQTLNFRSCAKAEQLRQALQELSGEAGAFGVRLYL